MFLYEEDNIVAETDQLKEAVKLEKFMLSDRQIIISPNILFGLAAKKQGEHYGISLGFIEKAEILQEEKK